MEILSKQEVAQNVMDYYIKNKQALQRGISTYNEKQGKGFVCWRFLMNESARNNNSSAAAADVDGASESDGGGNKRSQDPLSEDPESPAVAATSKRARPDNGGVASPILASSSHADAEADAVADGVETLVKIE